MHRTAPVRPGVRDWLWRPWYAKLWWAAIPVWWVGLAASTKVAPLAEFYSSALAGFLNVFFFPMTALMVLGVGWARMRLDHLSAVETEGYELDGETLMQIRQARERHMEAFSNLNAATDIYDPRSGTLYVGNSLSPNNGARISAF
ncbi:hypothetical protein GG804_22330 [Sphingomonas histidinilytica]|nr:hypothetical protein [Rhizorhabdus histidinilytica]